MIRLLAVVLAGAALAALLRRATGLGQGREELWVTARATLQLVLAGLIITAVLASWGLTAAFVALMIVVAARTSAARIGAATPVQRALVLVPIALGALPVTAALIGTGLLPAQPISLIPTAGILIGNAMTGTTLAGRQCGAALRERHGEVEAALALGLPDRDARLMVCQPAARLALVPNLDQTRTVGLVTLPGAFVGTLLGGATPLEAAALQLLVLTGILLAQSVAVPLTMYLFACARLAPAEPGR